MPPARPKFNWRRDTAVCAGLLLLVALAFYPVAGNEFLHYDDDDYVVENEYVNNGLTPHGISRAFFAVHAANWHPLTWVSHMVDCQLFKLRPAGHHLMNLAFHAANSIVLYLVLLRMTAAAWPSAAVAALFAVHPLHVESVAWVAERKDVLSTLFGLAALWTWLGCVARPSVGRYVFTLLVYAASLLSKPMLVTLPFLLLLLDWWPLERFTLSKAGDEPGKRRIWLLILEKVPFAILAALSSVITLVAQSGGHAVVPFTRLSIAARLATIARAYCGYLEKLFVPIKLAPIYPLPKLPNYPMAIACGFVLVAATLLLLWSARRRKYLGFGWLWYLGLLVPVIGVVHVGQQAMADRYSYLPAVGIFILLAWSAAEVVARWPRLKRPLAGLFATTLVACCLLSNAQVRLWATTKTLFTHTVAVTDENPVALTNLGLAAINDERYEDAERYLLAALRIDRTEIDTLGNLANLYRRQKKSDAALAVYRQLDHWCPNNARCYFQMAKTEEERHNDPAAEPYYRRAVELEPDSIVYRYWLAMNQQTQGKHADALKNYAEILRLRPLHVPVINNIAWICATSPDANARDGRRAIEVLRPAVERPACNANLLDTLAAAYAEAGQFDRAVETAQTAIRQASTEGLNASDIAGMKKRSDLYNDRRPYRDEKK